MLRLIAIRNLVCCGCPGRKSARVTKWKNNAEGVEKDGMDVSRALAEFNESRLPTKVIAKYESKGQNLPQVLQTMLR